LIEELSENVEAHAQELDKILQRSEDLMAALVEIYQGMIGSYKANFMLEEFVRFLHDAKPL
jgi:CII-binding regulator of phage lambda lysogenization HflD